MRRLLFIIVVIGSISFFGCGKAAPDNPACTAQAPVADSAALLTYAADSSIKAAWDSTGLYYQIIDSGSGLKPIATSTVTVNYVGRLMSGVLFDSASNTNLNGNQLFNLILGWRIGLPKIGVGGHIKLLVPSAYAYGCTGYGPVPPNAPLYFDIDLLSVN
jgi:FKBP-type peptidyl-prolyl cis-trans isomerase FkpA